MEKRTHFIKACQPVTGLIGLDHVVVAQNKYKGIETSLILDTNVLISIEKIVKHGNKWSSVKEHGLHNLVKLLQRCPPKSICISPGFSLSEMPPGLAENTRIAYDQFCSVHLPGFVDMPDAIRSKYSGKVSEYGFLDLEPIAQASLSVSFSSLLYLNLVDAKYHISPIDKFKKYIHFLEKNVDILSAAEVEIAKYCFVNPPAESRDIIKIRKVIRENFLKTKDGKLPRNASEVMEVAFNGACDIHLLQAANINDSNGINNVEQDTWIATKDKKLAAFSEIFHHIKSGKESGKIAASTVMSEHLQDIYWSQVDAEFSGRSKLRRDYHENREIDFFGMIDIAKEAISAIGKEFPAL